MAQTVDTSGGSDATPGGGNAAWYLNVWDPATGRWTRTPGSGPKPAMTLSCKYGPDNQMECREVPSDPNYGVTPTTPAAPEGPEKSVGKTRAEIEAGKYATIGGRDVYVETEAEKIARSAGLSRDSNGYYRLVGGQKIYQTGVDPESGRRFHYLANAPLDPFTGQRSMEEGVGIEYDDPSEYVTHGTRAELVARRRAAQDRLTALRDQYRNSRGDAWVVRNNLLTRIRDLEDEIMGIGRVLGDEPIPEVTHRVSGTSQTRFEGGVKINVDFAIDDPLTDLSFAAPLTHIPNGAYVVVRANIAFGERAWTPGRLAQPDMCRVEWDVPQAYLAIDGVPKATDEFICSNPLQVMRTFIAPATGNTNVGRGTDLVFGVKCAVYELSLEEDAPDSWHREGDDGYYGATLGIPGDVPTGDLARFMEGLGWVESHNNPTAENRHSHAWGEWQIMPRNWINWSRQLGIDPTPKTPEKSERLAVWRLGKMWSHRHSWRRTANAWHKGPSWERHHQDHLGDYARRALNHVGLPID